jgi:hypothetical protein
MLITPHGRLQTGPEMSASNHLNAPPSRHRHVTSKPSRLPFTFMMLAPRKDVSLLGRKNVPLIRPAEERARTISFESLIREPLNDSVSAKEFRSPPPVHIAERSPHVSPHRPRYEFDREYEKQLPCELSLLKAHISAGQSRFRFSPGSIFALS